MSNYLLVIDTETSSLPKRWDKPYSLSGNWPFAVQISWYVYTREGEVVKREDHYINNNDFEISEASFAIHKLDKQFLSAKGEERKNVLTLLSSDLNLYKPLVIGHCIELDFHVLGAEYYRSDMENPLTSLSTFCTMIASEKLSYNPARKYLRLGDLYKTLFNKPLLNQHNAIVDAGATGECFFEMHRRKLIDDRMIAEQPQPYAPVGRKLFYFF